MHSNVQTIDYNLNETIFIGYFIQPVQGVARLSPNDSWDSFHAAACVARYAENSGRMKYWD